MRHSQMCNYREEGRNTRVARGLLRSVVELVREANRTARDGGGGGGGRVLSIMDYTGMLRPKGLPFLG